MRQFYQVFSRKNDINGNPYRLIVLYSYEPCQHDPKPIAVAEARSSSPNYVFDLYQQGIPHLREIHVAPAEYNSLKRHFSHWLKLEHVD